MRRFPIAFAFLPLLAASGQLTVPFAVRPTTSGGDHSMTLVQTGTCATPGIGTTSVLNCTMGAGISSSDVVAIFGITNSGTQPSASSIGTFIVVPSAASGNYGVTAVITSISGSPTTFNLTVPSQYHSPSSVVSVVFEFSGVNVATPVNTSCGFNYTYNTTSSCSVTTTAAHGEVCAAAAALGAGTGVTAASGYRSYSVAGITFPSSPGTYALFECGTTSVGPGSYTPTFVNGGASAFEYATIAFNLV